jgi:taste receptor type 2
VINCIDWVKKRKLSSVDQILMILAISRIGAIWQILVSWFKTVQYSFTFMAGTELRILVFAWIISNHFSLWLSTILSIFYLLKIATFSRPAFLYLKWKVKKVTLTILLGNLLFLLLNLIEVNKHIEDWMHQLERNTTWNCKMSDFGIFSNLVIQKMILFSLMPFTVALISFFLLIFSLWKHLKKMQLTSKRHRDPRTKAHINALKIMISFLLLYATYFLSFFISWISRILESKLSYIVCLTIGLIYPSSHSFILILGNSKLRQAFVFMLKQLRCGPKPKTLTIP